MKSAILSLFAVAMLLSACGNMGYRSDQSASTGAMADDQNAYERAQGRMNRESAGPYN